MATTTRIKVSRDALLGKLRVERARLGKQHEKDEFEYDQKMWLTRPRSRVR